MGESIGVRAAMVPRESWPASVSVCVCMREWWSVPASGMGLAASRAPVSRCQQLGDWDPEGSYWADRVFESSCWRDPFVHTYIYIFSLLDLNSPQQDRGAR